MLRYQLNTQSATIVLLGKFNPSIFSPAWLRLVGAINEAELDAAKVTVIHPEITRFEIDDVTIDASIDRFSVSSASEPFVRILDLVQAIFARSLPHTPIRALGINYEVEFTLDSAKRRIALGRALAPTLPWADFGRRIDSSDDSGMIGVQMQETLPAGREAGHRMVSITPVRGKLAGVRLAINDHYELSIQDEVRGADRIMGVLAETFESSIRESKKIAEQLSEFAETLK